jgi:hypothetical protein
LHGRGAELPIRDVLVEPVDPANVSLHIGGLGAFRSSQTSVEDGENLIKRLGRLFS